MQKTDWVAEIITLANDRDMSLRELAADMGISHVYLGKVVRGEKPASAKLKIKIWGRRKYDLTREQMLELLLPDDIAEEFHEFEIERGKARARQAFLKEANKKAKSKTEGGE